MAHGTPDWGVTSGGVTVYQLTDLAELAARLGSPVTFDRRGDVIWLDSFEGGLNKWWGETSGVGSTLDLSMARARNGRYCARLVAGPTTEHWARMYHDQPYPVLSYMGAEWNYTLASLFGYAEWWLDLYDGSEWSKFHVRYVSSGSLLQYQDDAGDWVTIATDLSPKGSLFQFSTVKLVVDGPHDEYARLIVNSTKHSLAGIAAQKVASPAGPKLQVSAKIGGVDGSNSTLYVDDVIMTQNE